MRTSKYSSTNINHTALAFYDSLCLVTISCSLKACIKGKINGEGYLERAGVQTVQIEEEG